MDVCLAGAFGPAGDCSDLGYAESDDMAQDDGFALWPGEGVEASLPCLRVRRFDVDVFGLCRLLDQGRPPRTIAEMVPPQIECDGPNPRLDSKLPYPLRWIPGESPVCPDKCFLTQVLRLVPVTGHPAQAPVEAWRHVLNQTREGGVEIAG